MFRSPWSPEVWQYAQNRFDKQKLCRKGNIIASVSVSSPHSDGKHFFFKKNQGTLPQEKDPSVILYTWLVMWRQNLQACNLRCLKFHLKGNNITQNNDNSLEGIKCTAWNCNLEESRDSLGKIMDWFFFPDPLNNPTHFMWDKLPATERPFSQTRNYQWEGDVVMSRVPPPRPFLL